MLARTLSMLSPVRVTVGYAVALFSIAMTLWILGPHVQDRVISHLSTNLHNLVHGHLGTLVGSAFVTSTGPIYVWLPGLMCLLGVAELVWRSGRLVLTFALGHVGATLVVAVGLIAAIRFGWMPASVTRDSDVGISYGATAVLGALTAAVPARWRPAWIGWWLAVAVLVVFLGHDFTDIGHVVGLVLGMLVSVRFDPVTRWTALRYSLFGVGVSFGFLMLVNTPLPLIVAPLVGLLGALTGHAAAAQWRRRRRRCSPSAPKQTPETVEPEPLLPG
jgi:hypothetical protein